MNIVSEVREPVNTRYWSGLQVVMIILGLLRVTPMWTGDYSDVQPAWNRSDYVGM